MNKLTRILDPIKQATSDLLDMIDYVVRFFSGKTHLPPRSFRRYVGPTYEKDGKAWLGRFVELGGLRPNEKVLDIGCGSGRMAFPLTKYLATGEYCGMDIHKSIIEWCQNNISSKYPKFKFAYSDVYNKNYNPAGMIKASEYVFPYPDRSFDFIFLTSVFTHMMPNDMCNYLKEISRLLKDNGRALLTFLLLYKDKKEADAQEKPLRKMGYIYDSEIYCSPSKDNPESAIAYKEEYILNILSKYKLSVVEPVRYGKWTNKDGLQDMVIVKRQ